MSVYGDMLQYFKELFIPMVNFDMTPKPNAGWSARTNEKIFKGIFQDGDGEVVEDVAEQLFYGEIPYMWTRDNLRIGSFIEVYDTIFRIKKDGKWKFEGNFYRYQLEKLVGNDGTQTIDPDFTFGEGQFG